jgi:hypothetical protein
MSDHDTLPPETDDELRARMRALADEVKGRTDSEAALERMPSGSRPPTIRLLAIAACFVLAVVAAAVVMADRQPVETVLPAQSPECPTPAQPRAITPGGQMKNRFAAPVASAATALLLLGACGDDDGPTTLAQGEDVELVGNDDLGAQTLDISAEEDEDGDVTGEIQSTDVSGEVVVTVECADTDTDGVVILGGTVTESAGDEIQGLAALFIKEGDPDSVAVWFDEGENESCGDLLKNRRDVLDDESAFVDVEDGEDIQTG